jgi:hypothetical protein
MQADANDSFQSLDGIVQQVGRELRERADPVRFPVECGLLQSDVARLLGLRYEQPGMLARIGEGLRRHQGDAKNLRKRGGKDRTWVWRLTHAEADTLGFHALRPPMPRFGG